jgi:ATP-dependent Clp protease protease subunit
MFGVSQTTVRIRESVLSRPRKKFQPLVDEPVQGTQFPILYITLESLVDQRIIRRAMTTPTTDNNEHEDLYGIFTGKIDTQSLQKLAGNLAMACKELPTGLKRVHIAFQSNGGVIGEGIALYNLFRATPFELFLYNVGTVASISVVSYLGAQRRKVSAHGAFMIHRTQTTIQNANTEALKSFVDASTLSDNRTEAILRQHITMPNDKWSHYNHNDLWFSAEDSVKFGLADEIAEFSPPPNTELFCI